MTTTAESRCDHEIERNVLGVLLFETSAHAPILAKLRAEHFDHVAHQEVYRAIQELHAAGEPADNFTVRFHLMDARKIGDGPGFVMDSLEYEGLSSHAQFAAHVAAHADRIIKLWADRRMYECAGRLAAAAQEGRIDLIAPILAQLEALQREASGGCGGKADAKYFLSAEECEELEPARGIVGNILFEDSLAILYAQPGRWKTFLALDWALSCATDH